MPTQQTGKYRPAARLQEGWEIAKSDGSWSQITSLVQITSPMKFAMVTLADGTDVSIPHDQEVMTRTPAEAAKS